MSTIYNRVNDQTGTPQAKNKTVAARDELIPALTLREVPLAATSAMMESLNQATRQFAQLSEATMKAATEQMVRGATKK